MLCDQVIYAKLLGRPPRRGLIPRLSNWSRRLYVLIYELCFMKGNDVIDMLYDLQEFSINMIMLCYMFSCHVR